MAARQILVSSIRLSFNSKFPGNNTSVWNRSMSTSCVMSKAGLQMKFQKEQPISSNGILFQYNGSQFRHMGKTGHEISKGIFSAGKKFTTGTPLTYKTSYMTQFKASSTLQNYHQNLGKNSNVLSDFYGLKFVSFKSLFSTPFPFMVYGLGGLIPFLSAPLYMHWTGYYSPTIAYAQLAYGACILSFLGGVSWGSVLNDAKKVTLPSLCYSIFLPLAAWPAVIIFPNIASFPLLIGGITYAGYKDTQNVHYPLWFINLRLLLSIVVVITLSTTFIFQFIKDTAGSSISEVEIPASQIGKENAKN